MRKLVNYFKWPGEVFCMSDLHLYHKRVLEFERGIFSSIKEHNEAIISLAASVKPFDTLVLLGDLGEKEGIEKLIAAIKPNVHKVLLMGNHDKSSKNFYKQYFDEVYDGPLFVNRYMVLSHYPIPVNNNFINVHGHLHVSKIDDKYHINTNIHLLNYQLLNLGKIWDFACCTVEPVKQKFLKEWYADKYLFTEPRFDVVHYQDSMHILKKAELEELTLKLFDIMHRYEEEFKFDSIEEFRDFYFKQPNKNLNFFKGLNLLESDSENEKINKLLKFVKKVDIECQNISM